MVTSEACDTPARPASRNPAANKTNSLFLIIKTSFSFEFFRL